MGTCVGTSRIRLDPNSQCSCKQELLAQTDRGEASIRRQVQSKADPDRLLGVKRGRLSSMGDISRQAQTDASMQSNGRR